LSRHAFQASTPILSRAMRSSFAMRVVQHNCLAAATGVARRVIENTKARPKRLPVGVADDEARGGFLSRADGGRWRVSRPGAMLLGSSPENAPAGFLPGFQPVAGTVGF